MKKSQFITILFLCIAMLVMLTSCVGIQSESGIQGEQNEPEGAEPEVTYTVSTTSSTDDYGLAGNYTMLNAKKYEVGDKVVLSATVNNGYNFEGWYIDSVCLSTELEYTHVMQNKDIMINAKFSSYTITTKSSSNEANVAGKFTTLYNKKVSVGEDVELTATVNDGYNFEGWYINNICVSRSLNYTHKMEKENVEICAEYSCFTLTTLGNVKNGSGIEDDNFAAGTYTQYVNENISAGETITLTATVNDGYNFVGWHINGNCVSTDTSYSFVMGKESINITAVYSYYALKTTARWQHSGALKRQIEFENPDLCISKVYVGEKISIGEEITVIAQEIEGYTFSCWRTTDTVLCTDKTYTFKMPAGDVDIYALYIPN